MGENSADNQKEAAREWLHLYLWLDGWGGEIPSDGSTKIMLGLAGFESEEEFTEWDKEWL